jgi:hypothetical protein
MSETRKRGVKVLYLVLALVGILFVVFVIVPLFGRARESARMAQYVPGVGAIDAKSGQPMLAAGGAYGGGRGGMRGGGAAGVVMEAADQSAPPGYGGMGGFQARLATASRTSPMLIRTGSIRLRVEEVKSAFEEAARIVRAANGYIADSQFSSEEGPDYATMTVRLPAEGLDSVIERIARLGIVLHKQLGAEEVTEEYVDLSSRKRNLEREEERLLQLLNRAGKVKELLEVEQTLARVRGEIEVIAGRMRYLENRVALSALTIEFQGPQPQPTAGGPIWTPKDVWNTAVRSLIETGQALATMAIWIGVFSLVWVPLLLVLRWVARRAFPKG